MRLDVEHLGLHGRPQSIRLQIPERGCTRSPAYAEFPSAQCYQSRDDTYVLKVVLPSIRRLECV